MTDRDTRPDAVRKALAACAGGASFKDHAAALLNALGYRSELTEQVGSVADFVNWLDHEPDRPLTNKQRQAFSRWSAADIVFQFTDGEIAGQSGLFAEPFDLGRAKSFLFVAADLEPRPDGHTYSRTELAAMVRVVNSRLQMPVILLFRHGETLTLAAVHRRAHKRKDARDVLERVTLIKDIRAADPHRAHLDILCELALENHIQDGVRTFDDLHKAWERVLDIEELNRRFYRELFAWFERATRECTFPDDGAGDGSTERHAIRLITRLLFIWFLKEKGLVPERLFDEDFADGALKAHGSERTDYYRAVLQNLFFATLNTPIDKRAFSSRSQKTHRDFSLYRYRDLLNDPDGFVDCLRAVPFVNGGLFDCLDDFESRTGGGRRVDVFTDNETQRADLKVPARLLFDEAGLFPLFRKFKFTVEENTPIDQEVALDPELLGRVFEHLLAAYNPETRETARKTTGSYYTPRKVVDYMVHEALTEALTATAKSTEGDKQLWREQMDYLLDHSDAMDDASELFSDTEREAVVTAIANLKVIDPAVGSGAFPMAILQTLTSALRRLDPSNELWEKLQKQHATVRAGAAFNTDNQWQRDAELAEISDTFEKYRQSDFGRKLYLIQNSIFGVDVQPIACQIAKLRFFISLVIEQAADPAADNLGIKPLPNLETRFVAADTLLGPKQPRQGGLTSEAVGPLQEALQTNRKRHFHAGDRNTKLALRDEDSRLRRLLAEELHHTHGFTANVTEMVATWDPYDQNARADWFDAKYMFGVSGGFDVVIGNPPYVESRNSLLSVQMKRRYGQQVEADWNAALPQGSDLLIYFFARSAHLLNSFGIGYFITQNAWLSTDYGLAFQSFTAGRFSVACIIDTAAKFFSDPNGPNINAIIASFHKRPKANGDAMTIWHAVADADMTIQRRRKVKLRRGVKWGWSFSTPDFFDEILHEIASRCDSRLAGAMKFGQGINVPKSAIDQPGSDLGIMMKSILFVADEPDGYIQRTHIPKNRRPPALIMPRGIGDKHYCMYNSSGSMSFSAVELYLVPELWRSDLHYCLWVYMNSSIAWLFREITGRRNLGGGLLKAEASDMHSFPTACGFDFADAAREVLASLSQRAPLATNKEVYTEEHMVVDSIVGRYFGIDNRMEQIREALVSLMDTRLHRAGR